MSRRILSSDFYTLKKDSGAIKIELNPSYPTLYKYQPISEYSLHNFEYDEIWGTVPAAFNDPYDCSVCYSENKVNKFIKENLTEQRIENYKLFFQTTKKSDIAEFITRDLIDCDNYRKQYCVACFSIYNDSEIMWGHYADSAKGFCVAYSGDDLANTAWNCSRSTFDMMKKLNPFGIDFENIKDDNLISIAPIIYLNGKYNATEELIRSIPFLLEYYDDLCEKRSLGDPTKNLLNNLENSFYSQLETHNNVFYSMMCNKNRVWSYEQEWRIWTYNSNILAGNFVSPYMCIGKVRAKAVYLGEKIPEYYRRTIIGIAKEKNIPVYQMKSKMYKHYFVLKPVLQTI